MQFFFCQFCENDFGLLRAKRAPAGGLANGAEEIDVQSLISTQIKDSEIRVEHKTQSVVNQNKIVTKIPIFLPDV